MQIGRRVLVSCRFVGSVKDFGTCPGQAFSCFRSRCLAFGDSLIHLLLALLDLRLKVVHPAGQEVLLASNERDEEAIHLAIMFGCHRRKDARDGMEHPGCEHVPLAELLCMQSVMQ